MNGTVNELKKRIAELEGKLAESLKQQAVEQRSGFWGRAAVRYLNQRDDLRALRRKALRYDSRSNATTMSTQLAEAHESAADWHRVADARSAELIACRERLAEEDSDA